MRLILNLLVLALLVGSFQSCVSKKKYDELQASKEATDQSLAETQAQVQGLEQQNEELQAEMEANNQRMSGEIEDLRSDLNETRQEMSQTSSELQARENELEELRETIAGSFESYEDAGLSVETRDGNMYVITKEPVQYRIGSSRLSSAERDALSELADVLKNNPDLKILVEGHTDTLKYPADAGMDNWDLSVRRAMGVVRYLISQGVNADQVAAAGYGEARPTATNETEDGRAQNRRTMIRPEVDMQKLNETLGNN